jgi:pimeloyl-ACP methyl ester carboxylesterase
MRSWMLLVLLLIGSFAPISAQNADSLLSPDQSEKRDPLGSRTPLILIHGLCGGEDTWTNGGFRDYVVADAWLHSHFKVYYFNYSSGGDTWRRSLKWIGCNPSGNAIHDVQRVQSLAIALEAALSDRPEIGSSKPIEIIAHSLGGLIARSFLQERSQYDRTKLLVTLATPHHGTQLAVSPSGDLAALDFDYYLLGSAPGANEWLRCLNGVETNGACAGGDQQTRDATFRKMALFGLDGADIYGLPDDGLVNLDSALLRSASARVKARFSGHWALSKITAVYDPAYCYDHVLAHIAIHYQDCVVSAYPSSGDQPQPIFDVIKRLLIESNGPPLPVISAPVGTWSLTSDGAVTAIDRASFGSNGFGSEFVSSSPDSGINGGYCGGPGSATSTLQGTSGSPLSLQALVGLNVFDFGISGLNCTEPGYYYFKLYDYGVWGPGDEALVYVLYYDGVTVTAVNP